MGGKGLEASGVGADVIPVETAAHIARAIPNTHLASLKGCGHFSYLECPDAVRKEIQYFMAPAHGRPRSE